MNPTRREFVKVAMGAAAAGGLAMRVKAKDPPASDRPTDKPSANPGKARADKPLKLLILGGTAFLGPEVVEAATSRGHTITLFNRGKTRPTLFPGLEKLHGDRDPDKGDGLKALKDRRFDAVIDTSGYYPRHVRASAELLAPGVDQYVFISSISVYKRNDKPGSDESAELSTIADPTVESMGSQSENYGPLKALCEHAAEKAMPGRVTNIRPGYIVGPGDWSGRFTYWPLRIEKSGGGGQEVLAPGKPEDPIQVIDVRDLGEWIIHCIENRTVGVFNACGPKDRLTWGKVLDDCKAATKSDAKLEWVDPAFLEKHGKPGDYFPIWLNPHGETAGFHSWSNKRAVAKGLRFRPLGSTIVDLLAWYKALEPDKQARFVAGISRERELELLKLWNERTEPG